MFVLIHFLLLAGRGAGVFLQGIYTTVVYLRTHPLPPPPSPVSVTYCLQHHLRLLGSGSQDDEKSKPATENLPEKN